MNNRINTILSILVVFLREWVWQLPQNAIGWGYKVLNKEDIICETTRENDDCRVFLKRSKNSVSLGKYIYVHQYYRDLTFVIKHELGHRKQSLILGPLYLFVIGIPSALWNAWIHPYFFPNRSYYDIWMERWANKLAGLE